MNNVLLEQIFICFAAEDRYNIVEPILYHLKNYGLNVWYDRVFLLMGDNRIEKNLIEGAYKSKCVVLVISKNTSASACAMEEISIVKSNYYNGKNVVFPILYEMSPNQLPQELNWIKELIFKEVLKNSGTREICNHIACKITNDYLSESRYRNIQDIINTSSIPPVLQQLLTDYLTIDNSNLNSRIAILYSSYLIMYSKNSHIESPIAGLVKKIYDRLFAETKLNLLIDYRELWLLENSLCLLADCYYKSSTDFKISITN